MVHTLPGRGVVAVCFAVWALAASAGLTEQVQAPLLQEEAASRGKNPLTEELGEFVREKLDKWKVPGMALAVVDGDDVFAEGYGFATLPDVKASPDTLFYGASTTKAQTAAVLAQLIDSGEYPALTHGWETPISFVIRDDFVLQDAWATAHLTLEDAASHRTGMPRHDKAAARVVNGTRVTQRDIVRNLRNLHLNKEPRVAFQYCNLMYVVLGHVVETLTGKPLAQTMREVLWKPLGMKSTYLRFGDVPKDRLAQGYYWDKDAHRYHKVPHMDLAEQAGAGALISSVVDYAQWVKCLLHEAVPFSKRVHAEIRKPRIMASTSPLAGHDIALYTLGWQRVLYKGHVIYKHNGGVDSFGAQVYWIPEADFGAVAFANTALTSNAVEDIVIYRLIEDKLGIPQNERFDFEKKWQHEIDKETKPVEDVGKLLFPNHPKPPLPSSFKPADLVGRYWSAGYGEFTLQTEPHPEGGDDTMLVADRKDMSWRYRMELRHVSGDYWVVDLFMPQNPTFTRDYMPAEFRRGSSGNVSSLDIRFLYRAEDLDEGRVSFQRL